MKIFNKKNLLLSSAVVAGMLFTVGTKAVQADTTNDLQQETTDNNAKSNIQPRNKNESVQTQTLTIQKVNQDNKTPSSVNKSSQINFTNNISENEILEDYDQKFQNMSAEQLSNFISEIKGKETQSQLYGTSKIGGVGGAWLDAKIAWLAAAAIANQKGYTCSATLVRNSVYNKPYSEWSRGGGLFASKIKHNSDYLSAKKRHAKSFAFTKSHGSDLFYALHNVNANYHYTQKHPIHIYDRFNFDRLWKYNGLAGVANNIGFLSQHTYVLHDIKVDIYFWEQFLCVEND